MSLVQHFGLQDNAASTTVVAAVGNTGTLNGGDNTSTLSTTGPGGSYPLALNFNGSDDFISFTSVSVSGAGTWCWWCKRDTTNTADAVVGSRTGSGGNNRLGFDANSTNMYIVLRHASSAVTPAHGVDSTQWHHYAIIRNSSNIVSLYVDGSLVNSDIYSGADSGTVGDLGGVAAWAGFSAWFDGCIADYRIYNSDESANISTIYGAGVSSGFKPWYARGSNVLIGPLG